MDGFGYVGVEGFQCGENFFHIHVAKALRWEKGA
jgi:hypothetical protein